MTNLVYWRYLVGGPISDQVLKNRQIFCLSVCMSVCPLAPTLSDSPTPMDGPQPSDPIGWPFDPNGYTPPASPQIPFTGPQTV